MIDATSPIEPTIAARLAGVEALVVAQRAALEAERTRRTAAEACWRTPGNAKVCAG